MSLDRLFTFQSSVLGPVSNTFKRSLADGIHWKQRMIGIRGLRGTGKTTLLLQHLKYRLAGKGLYVTADHPWFYENSLLDVADAFDKEGGKTLLIDEIHKYPHWSAQLKNVYDGFPGLQIIFTASSALDIQHGEADLSRRVRSYELPGLSFREYLSYATGETYDRLSLEEILRDAPALTSSLKFKQKVLPLFRNYLRTGYFPFSKGEEAGNFLVKLNQVINVVLESDLTVIKGYSANNIFQIKRLLGVLAESVPFTPNISALAAKMKLGRDTVNNFILHLESARLLNLLYEKPKGTASLQKPGKIYLENTNLSFALRDQPETGSLRETFLLNQLRNADHSVSLPRNGDFLVDKKWTLEAGGATKTNRQVADTKGSYLAIDGIEVGYQNRIPLWLFGFLY